ncbi:MAG: four helix bundle suffix domain-containing protein [Patescibacteria group bacterium]
MDKNYKGYKQSLKPSGYKTLPFFQQAEIVYDGTVEFCDRYIRSLRQKEQMTQAARSGKQCIAEGYLQKSVEGRLKMLGVSRGSYEELLNDFLDFLRQRGLTLWLKDDPRSLAIRRIAYKNYKSYKDYKIYIQKSPETAANTLICLINQTNSLLDQKLRWTEERFIKEGGFRENLFRKRLEFKKGKSR